MTPGIEWIRLHEAQHARPLEISLRRSQPGLLELMYAIDESPNREHRHTVPLDGSDQEGDCCIAAGN